MCILHAPTIIGHVHICKKFFDFMIFGSYARFEIYVYHRRAIWERGELSSLTFSFIEKSAQFLDQIPCLQT